MKIYFSIILLLVGSLNSVYSQNQYLLEDEYFFDMKTLENGSKSRFAEFDSSRMLYEVNRISQFGGVIYKIRLDSLGKEKVDTTFGYHINGNIATLQVYLNNTRHGNFAVYDSLGNLLNSGCFYKDIRIGTWNYFNMDGTIYQKHEYKYSLSDSSFLESSLDSLFNLEEYIVEDAISLFNRKFQLSNGEYYYEAEYKEYRRSLAFVKKIENHHSKDARDYYLYEDFIFREE